MTIAVASACGHCAPEIGSPPEVAPGRHMTILHASHIPGLEADGWITLRHAHEEPDVVCPHYYAAHITSAATAPRHPAA